MPLHSDEHPLEREELRPERIKVQYPPPEEGLPTIGYFLLLPHVNGKPRYVIRPQPSRVPPPSMPPGTCLLAEQLGTSIPKVMAVDWLNRGQWVPG